MTRRDIAKVLISTVLALPAGCAANLSSGLAGHWPLVEDARDHSGNGNHGRNHGATFVDKGPPGSAAGAAMLDGRNDYIEVADSETLRFGTGDFSISVWVHTEEKLDDVLGDIVSKYDPKTRTGLNLSILNYAGVTSHQPNFRNLHFGIDSGRIEEGWSDCGRPGNNLFVCALAVHDGELYAGTFETHAHESGHVYRYASGKAWVDCGSPDRSNSVFALAVFNGELYAGTANYRARGSALPESTNQHPGGRVYRYEGGKRWADCGQLQNPDTGTAATVHSLVVFRGKLFASTIYREGFGLYEYEGGRKWTYRGNPRRRVEVLGVYNGSLYTTSYDGGALARYDGPGQWTDLGSLAKTSQAYAFAVHRGDLFVTTWPNGTVFRLGDDDHWINQGRLGDEKEVMGAAVYNGKLYAGTLPLAEVYRYDGDTTWTRTGQLDTTPDVKYRRAWSMAVFRGRLFCGTLPSGHVYAFEAGKSVTYDHELQPGWRHVVAVRSGAQLKLYVDGRLVATSSAFNSADYDISNDRPLRIGFGAHDHFNGHLSDLRIYNRALTATDVTVLFGHP